MNIGDFKYRVTIKNPTISQSVTGGTTQSFTTVTTVWADIDQKSGGLSIDSQLENKKAYKISFRYSSVIAAALSTNTVLNDGERDYSVVNIDTDKRYYFLLCVTK
jgi:head-tail adaptor